MMQDNLVSIILPMYNGELYVRQAIDSVLTQTYPNWELILVDDKSTDLSFSIAKKFENDDSRINVYQLLNNSGSASAPRNYGIEKANGEFIAFLDADDKWAPEKLQLQVNLARENDASIVYSYYEKIDCLGNSGNRVIKAPLTVSYEKLLYGNVIGCLTAMYSVKKLGKLYFKQIKHEDFALWLSALKKNNDIAYCVPKVLAYYRVGKESLSSNKWKAIFWTWHIYRKEENLNLLNASLVFISYAFKSFVKYIK